MYRIITSTTKEEHFESPNAAAFGMMTYCGSNAPTMPGTTSSTMPLRVSIRTPQSAAASTASYYGDYDIYGDLYVHGNIFARNLVEPVTEYKTKIMMLDTDPTGPNWTGSPGDMAFTSNHAYICVENDSWVKLSLVHSW